jgi:hypothetical protein
MCYQLLNPTLQHIHYINVNNPNVSYTETLQTPQLRFRKRAIPTERGPALCWRSWCHLLREELSRGQSNEYLWSLISLSRPESLLFFQVPPHLSSRGSADSVLDPLLRKYGSVRKLTRDFWICSQEVTTLPQKAVNISYPDINYSSKISYKNKIYLITNYFK